VGQRWWSQEADWLYPVKLLVTLSTESSNFGGSKELQRILAAPYWNCPFYIDLLDVSTTPEEASLKGF
jgi:hypothetical protein